MLAQEGRRTIPTAISPTAVAAAVDAVPDDEVVAGVVDAFRTLADPTRARILYALTHGPLCVRDLALVVGVSESAVSHQLRLLREKHLVKGRSARQCEVDATEVFEAPAWHLSA
jgi:DNA-binding transcriptional ArsR family regulator